MKNIGQSMNSSAQLWTSTIKSPFDLITQCCQQVAGCCQRISAQGGVSQLVKQILK
jgi:hypothetical protein